MAKRLTGWLTGQDLTAAGEVWLTESLIHFREPRGSGFIVLQHVEGAIARGDRMDVLLPGRTFTISGLCRSAPMAMMINGIIDGSYPAEQPFPPSCRTCRHRLANAGCGTQPPVIAPSECCADRQHQDWCPAFRPISKPTPENGE